MYRMSIMLLLILFASCKDVRLKQYETIVRDADRFQIVTNEKVKPVSIPTHEIEQFKAILVRNVKPGLQRKFLSDIRVEFYKNDERTAVLIISKGTENPFANFHAGKLNFGFKMTYGLGMTLANSR